MTRSPASSERPWVAGTTRVIALLDQEPIDGQDDQCDHGQVAPDLYQDLAPEIWLNRRIIAA